MVNKERPILFTGDMVRAILDGRKTQTRRIIKPQPPVPECSYTQLLKKCPYGQPGDILYVKETFRKYCNHDDRRGYLGEDIIEYAADRPEPLVMHDGDGFSMYNKDGSQKMLPWTSPRFMPKAAARIWLQVTDIRPERVQDISEEDAMAEGVKPMEALHPHLFRGPHHFAFGRLWRDINGVNSWNNNDWVWVIYYRVLSTTGCPAKFPALNESI